MIRDDIRSVALCGNLFCVGQSNSVSGLLGDPGQMVTRIAISERNGQMAPVRWVEIWAGDFLWIEFDACQAQGIEYQARPAS